jgi:hypothetical protein
MDAGGVATDADIYIDVAAFGLEPERQPRNLPSVPRSDDDFTRLAEGAFGQKLSGLLLDTIEEGYFAATSAQGDLAAALAAEWYARTRIVDAALLRAHAALLAESIDHRVVKGAATAIAVYGDTLRRPYVDADVAVTRQQFAAALALLIKSGWRRVEPDKRRGFDQRFGQATALELDGAYLDLHRMLVHPPAGDVLPGDAPFTAPPSTVVLDGVEIPVLPLPDALVHAVAHATFDPPGVVGRLLVARDLVGHDNLVLPADRRGRARAWGIETIVDNAILEARRALHLSTEEVEPVPLPPAEQHLLHLQRRMRGLARVGHLPSWSDRAQFVLAGLAPSREYLEHFGWTRRSYLASYVRAARGRL